MLLFLLAPRLAPSILFSVCRSLFHRLLFCKGGNIGVREDEVRGLPTLTPRQDRAPWGPRCMARGPFPHPSSLARPRFSVLRPRIWRSQVHLAEGFLSITAAGAEGGRQGGHFQTTDASLHPGPGAPFLIRFQEGALLGGVRAPPWCPPHPPSAVTPATSDSHLPLRPGLLPARSVLQDCVLLGAAKSTACVCPKPHDLLDLIILPHPVPWPYPGLCHLPR